MKQKILPFIIIIFIMISTPSYTTYAKEKIQVNDTWAYKSSSNDLFNETVVDEYEYINVATGDVTSFSVVNTTRPQNFDYYHNFTTNLYSIEIDMKPKSNQIFMTKTGSIPIFSDASLFGNITFTDKNNSSDNFNFNINNMILNRATFKGTPSKIFATAESELYSIDKVYIMSDNNIDNTTNINTNTNISNNDYIALYIYKEILLSTNSSQNDPKMDITFSVVNFDFIFEYLTSNFNIQVRIKKVNSSYEFKYSKIYHNNNNKLKNNVINNEIYDYNIPSYLISWNNSKMPSFISQTENVKIKSGLQLSNINNKIINYYLQTEDDNTLSVSYSTSEETPISFIFSFSIIAVIIIKKYK